MMSSEEENNDQQPENTIQATESPSASITAVHNNVPPSWNFPLLSSLNYVSCRIT